MIYINNELDILNFLQSQGIIDLDDVQEKMKEQERQRLLSKHNYKIFFDDKDNRWKTTVPDETKKTGRRIIAKRNRIDLDNELIAYYAKIEDDLYLSQTLYTLETLFPLWLNYKVTQTDASSYGKRILVDWNKYYKDTPIVKELICDLTYLKLHDWVHKIIKKNSLTRKQYYNMAVIMRQCLDYACELELGIITENPFSRIKIKKNIFTPKPKTDNNSQVFLITEQKMLCAEAQKKFDVREWCITPLMILLNFQLGLRIGELVALKWTDIEGDYLHVQRMEQTTFEFQYEGNEVISIPTGYITVPHAKSDAGNRTVYLNSYAKEILRTIRLICIKYNYYDDGYIYIQSRSKTRGTSRTLTKYLGELCLSSGVTNKSNHKVRKTQISAMFDHGINLNTIREHAGHEDERTTYNNYCFDQQDDSEKKRLLEASANKIMVIRAV